MRDSKLRRVLWMLIFGLCAAFTISPPLSAQSPQSPLRIIVPFAPGGAQDVIARWFADRLAPRLGATVIVENKAGAGGLLAADAVAKAAPDGATLLLATGGAITIAPHLQSKMPYDVRADFVAVALVADTPMTLAVGAHSPFKTIADVVREAKAKPGQIAYASTGNATVSHLTGALFAQVLGIELLHVPYKGAAPAISDVIGGQVPLIVTSAASIDPMAEAGKARVLASFSKAPLTGLANVPTVATVAGVAGLEVPVWVGFLAPAKTPADRLERLTREVLAICTLPETAARYKSLGAATTCGGRAMLETVMRDDSARWAEVVKRGNIKLE